jgi:5-methylcytosine-specific restriction endonuclease McrA
MADYYHSERHKRWRAAVLRRDKYLCQDCLAYGRKTPATTAHHIKERADYPELQYDVDNGVALCAACHNKRHPGKGGYREHANRF